ncbi:MAG: histidinol-phosphate transaminase [Candidatus Tectimicrobiota bacterium]
MRTLVPAHIAALQPYQPGKPIEEVERELGIAEAVKLASNENPLGPSPKAWEAARRALGEVHRYPDGGAYYLRHALAERLGVGPDEVVVGNGSNDVLVLLTQALMTPDDEAVVGDPAFVVYRLAVQAMGARVVAVPLADFTHDLPAMAQAVTERTRLLFVANPNNPTGTMVTAEAVEALLAEVPDHVVVVMDEAYVEYIDREDFPDCLAAVRAGRPVVVYRTFSKIYGLAGLRVGYAVAPKSLVAAINQIRAPFNVNRVGQAAALAALDDDAHVRTSQEVNRVGLAHLTAGLAALGVAYVPSVANFLLVEVGDGRAAYEALLRQGVVVRPMGGYGLAPYVRVTVGTAEENTRFLEALKAWRATGGAA